MRYEDDEINPFSREYTAKRGNEPAPATPPAPRAPRQRGGSNCLVWLVPLLLVLIIFPLVCCGGLLYWGVGKITEPLDAAVAAIEAEEEIVAKLGSPVERLSKFGVEDYENDNGNGGAEVDFNIKGPVGSARVQGKMKLQAGVWSPEDLTITCSDETEFKLPVTVDIEAGQRL